MRHRPGPISVSIDRGNSLRCKRIRMKVRREYQATACSLQIDQPGDVEEWGWSAAPPPARGAPDSIDGNRPSFSIETPSSAVHLTLPGIRGWTAGALLPSRSEERRGGEEGR